MKMTMTAIRARAKEMIQFTRMTGNYQPMVWYYEEMLRVVEELYKTGACKEFSLDILKEANGYKINYSDPEFSVNQTLDLHSITATKAAAKRFGYECFGLTW